MDDIWSEQEIVRGLQNGDSNAWTALCSQCGERLWRYVARFIGSNEAAVADVFQETLLAVARAGRSLADGSQIWPWLATIGHNQCALYWRNQSRHSTEGLVEELTATATDDVLLKQEVVAAVRKLLTEMPADYVTVLTEKYAEGRSLIDIAHQLNEGIEAVRSRLARARKEFRRRYEALQEAELARQEK